ncbi:MAG: hypothetical protein GY856_11495 [bacterium]|nr:hypothetical protein [bacterium]
MDKKTQQSIPLLAVLALCLLSAWPAAGSDPAVITGAGTALTLTPADQRVVLTVSGPAGLLWTETFAAGSAPVFELVDDAGKLFPDGGYNWELRSAPLASTRVRGAEVPAAEKRPAGPLAAGHFSIVDGGFAAPDGMEETDLKQYVHNSDVVIVGSLCVGFDCPTSPAFGFDTIMLMENNLRILFDDTSSLASFPTNNWRITVNDSTNGGASYFAVDDVDDGTNPFRIEAGAPSNALYVEDYGRIGLGTSTPAVELHLVDGDTPTVRLDQDGTSGWAAQVWDVAGNETNFFVRDVTGGSRLPFRIQPGAPSSSLSIRSTGYVGVGTWDPDDMLHVEAGGSVLPGIRIVNTDVDTDGWSFRVVDADEFRISKQSVSGPELKIDASGNVTIKGTLTVRDGEADEETYPDYVFEPGYPLMPMAELRAFVEENRHLPKIPPAAELARNGLNMTEMQLKLLEKVEELTLYTLALQETVQAQQEVIEELRTQLVAPQH